MGCGSCAKSPREFTMAPFMRCGIMAVMEAIAMQWDMLLRAMELIGRNIPDNPVLSSRLLPDHLIPNGYGRHAFC